MNLTLSSSDGMRIFPVGTEFRMSVFRNEGGVSVVADGTVLLTLRLDASQERVTVLHGSDDARLILDAMSAAAEALFGWSPVSKKLVIDLADKHSAAASLLKENGLAINVDDRLTILPELAMQRRDNWLVGAARSPQPPRAAPQAPCRCGMINPNKGAPRPL